MTKSILDLQECMVDQGVMVAMVWALEATVEVVVAEDMAIMDHLGVDTLLHNSSSNNMEVPGVATTSSHGNNPNRHSHSNHHRKLPSLQHQCNNRGIHTTITTNSHSSNSSLQAPHSRLHQPSSNLCNQLHRCQLIVLHRLQHSQPLHLGLCQDKHHPLQHRIQTNLQHTTDNKLPRLSLQLKLRCPTRPSLVNQTLASNGLTTTGS